jgi:hypothetical protein
MGRDFITGYKEHMRDIRYNQYKSKYSQHICDQNHEYGPIESTMDVLKVTHKGKNILERFWQLRKKPMLNEQHASDSDVLFDVMLDNEGFMG